MIANLEKTPRNHHCPKSRNSETLGTVTAEMRTCVTARASGAISPASNGLLLISVSTTEIQKLESSEKWFFTQRSASPAGLAGPAAVSARHACRKESDARRDSAPSGRAAGPGPRVLGGEGLRMAAGRGALSESGAPPRVGVPQALRRGTAGAEPGL